MDKMSKMEAMKENIIRYFDHLFEHKMHDNSHSDYNNVIESLGDYCVERMKEDMDDHLKECHPFPNGIGIKIQEWYENLRCPIHGEIHIHSMDNDSHGVYAIGWQCGCTFRLR
jgi:hypothetical protein